MAAGQQTGNRLSDGRALPQDRGGDRVLQRPHPPRGIRTGGISGDGVAGDIALVHLGLQQAPPGVYGPRHALTVTRKGAAPFTRRGPLGGIGRELYCVAVEATKRTPGMLMMPKRSRRPVTMLRTVTCDAPRAQM